LEDELKKVCQEMSNHELHESEFGCIMKTAQEVGISFYAIPESIKNILH
jgi:hypothetical protein